MFKFGSTSPLPHKPIVTLVVLAINLVLGLIALGDAKSIGEFALSYDVGIQPVQWFTGPFVHTSIIHLIGNLIFLGTFCVFVEGKLGPAVFVPVFIAACIASAAIEQSILRTEASETAAAATAATGQPMSTAEAEAYFEELNKRRQGGVSGSTGASTAIFGLIAICLVWSPSSSFLIGNPSEPTEVPLIGFVVLFVVWEAVKWYLASFGKGGLPIHLVGLIPGLVLAVICIQAGLADTKGEDILSSMGSAAENQPGAKPRTEYVAPTENASDRRAKAARIREERKQAEIEKQKLFNEAAAAVAKPTTELKKQVTEVDPAITKIQREIGSGNHLNAVKLIESITNSELLEQLPVSDYNQLAKGMMDGKRWKAAIFVLEKSITGHPDEANDRLIKLARLQFGLKQYDPCQSTLGMVRRKELTPEQDKQFKQLVIQVRQTQ